MQKIYAITLRAKHAQNWVKHDPDVVSSVSRIAIWAETRSNFIAVERTFKLPDNFFSCSYKIPLTVTIA